MNGVIPLIALLVLLVALFGWYLGVAHDTGIRMLQRAHEADVAVLVSIIEGQQQQQKEANAKWAQLLNENEERHAKDYETLIKGLTGGTQPPPPPDAEYIPHEPDSVERMERQISKETIDRGAKIIASRYREAGLSISDEDARKEASEMLAGRFTST